MSHSNDAPPARTASSRPPHRGLTRSTVALGAAALLIGGGTAAGAHGDPRGGDAEDRALRFDPAAYTTLTVTVDGQPTEVRWYQELCYVADPVLMAAQQMRFGQPVTIDNPECGYQSMNVYVPEAAFDDDEAALYFAVNNSGWFASYVGASVTQGASYDTSTSNIGAALGAGYVVINVGTRSREVIGADGSWPGKSPAPVVDAKAAVRYLRLNDAAMPGSAERIVVNGTSGGGGLSAILGASGNNADYLPYLEEIGAAGIDRKGRSTLRDDVLAIIAYCPITDLGHADIAYEWLYSILDTREVTGQNPFPETTEELAAQFAAYEKSLKLRDPDGSRLTAGTMLDALRDEVVRSADAFMQAGGVIEGYDWIVVDNDSDTVTSVDLAAYLAYVATQTTLKPAPSFDQSGTPAPGSLGGPGQGESSLFGSADAAYSNFTAYSWDHNQVLGDGSGLDDTGLTWAQLLRKRSTVVDEQVSLLDPMEYIGTGADTAPYWYVRHGALDRDTAFTVSINLDRALEADRSVRDVDYRLAWNTKHAGNYDVPEAMAWIAEVLDAADAPVRHRR
ncbi:subtype B tannase [Demequina iriomotensis]|uniref:subtype B tannase n=1 Tax=Demequina iriomotensis TaxID=1536641 RepID=UPI0007821D58|nr:subtype B tannase [Demequina iriomotensis]